jgi:putative Mg2+ transporter-C (MgtC) family protein
MKGNYRVMELAYTEVIIRLALAVLVGFLIGLERESRHRPAGIKTHMLVCIGATVVSLIQIEIVSDVVRRIGEDPLLKDVLKADVGRLGAQVISGIGFLGAGTILRTKGSVKGLTTAATLWAVACLGLGIGMGYYFISISAAVLVIAILTLLRLFQSAVEKRKGVKEIEMVFVKKKETMGMISEYFQSKFIRVVSIDFAEEHEETFHFGQPVYRCVYKLIIPRTVDFKNVIMELGMENDIIKVNEDDKMI